MMKTRCICNKGGYENLLKNGKEYEVLSVSKGTFHGDYYVTVQNDYGRQSSGYSWRFDIPEDKVKELACAQ